MEFARRVAVLHPRARDTPLKTPIYGGALPIMIALAVAGARKAPVLAACLVALLLPFHFVGHKEYRFAVVAAPAMAVLLSLGAVDVLARFAPASRRASMWTMAGWIVAMTAMSFSDSYRPFWTRDRNQIFAFRDIGVEPDACGVAVASAGGTRPATGRP